jgi:HEAT repeat protein
MKSELSYYKSREDYAEQKRNDPPSTEDLFHAALTAPDEETEDEATTILWYRTSHDVVEVAERFAESPDPDARRIAACVLGRGGYEDAALPEETAAILLRMLENEHVSDVLAAVCTCLGYRRESRAVPMLIKLINHPTAIVRQGVANGFLCQEGEEAIKALITLSTDEDDDVRDWATFGIGSMVDFDTPELREALLSRMSDQHRDTRGEALLGLAKRKDERVMGPLLLEIDSQSVGSLALEAAAEMANPALCPALLRLRAEIGEDLELDRAIDSCNCEAQ